MQKTKSEKLEKEKMMIRRVLFIPIILLLAVVPLISRVKFTPLIDSVASIYLTNMGYDFFSQYKAMAVIALCGLMLLILIFVFKKKEIKIDKRLLVYYGAAGVFLIFTLLSTIFSPYKEVAIWGVYDKAEGVVIMVCYILIMLYGIYTLQDKVQYRYIVLALSVLVAITTVIGIFQYMDKDLLLETEFGRKLIIPKEYRELEGFLGTQMQGGKRISGTMFHYNYMGSFGAMMVPLFATLTLFIKGRKEKLFLGIMTTASMFLLFGSTSRAGLIGLIASIVVGMLIFAKKMIKKWKVVLPVILASGMVLVGFNIATGGTIFQRIPTLIADAVGIFEKGDAEIDYKAYMPINDIKTEEGKTTLVTQTDTITLEKAGESIGFTDSQGKVVEYVLNGDTYTTQDQRFNWMSFKVGQIKEASTQEVVEAMTANINGVDTLAFRIDEVKGIYLINLYSGAPFEIQYPDTLGFKGKERIGSARGYIWSRSFPMLKDTLLLGYGPDAYVMAFPQEDLFGKWYAYETPNMVVSKPHNLYLQIALNEGAIALLAFLVIVLGYIGHGLKLYAFKGYYKPIEILAIANMLAVVGYLGAGFFNDSVISVAPIFWLLLGVGIALNYLVTQEKKSINL